MAIELPESVRRGLAAIQDRLRGQLDGIRWTRPEQIHLTLKFLGEVHESDVTTVTDAVRAAAVESAPFDLAIEGLGCFPPRGPARVIWAGFREFPPDLLECQKRCDTHLAACGFPPENRPFSPHLTLARIQEPKTRQDVRSILQNQSRVALEPFIVNELVLFHSLLQPMGAVHTAMARFPLTSWGP